MFGWLKRKRKSTARPRRRLPQRHLAPVEEIVEQGLLVADVATRMTVKNTIILNALGHQANYREAEIVEMVRDSVTELAIERERDARHIERMRDEIRATGHSSWSENDYGSDDSRTLRHRQEVYERVAEELHLRAADETYLRDTAERARTAAWHEIGASLEERATHPYYAGGASGEYRRERESRIDLLIQRDLAELMRERADGQADTDGSAPSNPSSERQPRSTTRKPRLTRRRS